MFTRFIDIVNSLEALWKTYKELEKEMKILRSLPKKWEAKVTIIQEAKDLTKLPLENLIRSLMTHEITMKSHWDVEEKKKKSITLKIITHEEEFEETENESRKDENLALMKMKFRKFMKGEKFKGRSLEKFPKRKKHHRMETNRKERRKGPYCATSVRNQDTLSMIVLFTIVKLIWEHSYCRFKLSNSLSLSLSLSIYIYILFLKPFVSIKIDLENSKDRCMHLTWSRARKWNNQEKKKYFFLVPTTMLREIGWKTIR